MCDASSQLDRVAGPRPFTKVWRIRAYRGLPTLEHCGGACRMPSLVNRQYQPKASTPPELEPRVGTGAFDVGSGLQLIRTSRVARRRLSAAAKMSNTPTQTYQFPSKTVKTDYPVSKCPICCTFPATA